MKNTIIASTVLTAAILANPISAQAGEIPGEFDSYITFTTDYTFRGITQSDEGGALQGGVDWSHESGAYAGIWASSVDFNDDTDGEVDFFVGYTNEAMENLSYDLSLIYYAYPGAPSGTNYDFYEVYGAWTYDFDVVALTASANYTPDNYGKTDEATYITGSVSVPLRYDLSLDAHIGHQYITDEAAFGVPDYTDWAVGVTYEYEDFAFNLAYTDTDLSTAQCADGCGSKAIFAVSASF